MFGIFKPITISDVIAIIVEDGNNGIHSTNVCRMQYGNIIAMALQFVYLTKSKGKKGAANRMCHTNFI